MSSMLPLAGIRISRGWWAGVLVCLATRALWAAEPLVEDARALIPWKELGPEARALIDDVVSNPTVYHRSQSEVFASSPELYLMLLHEPVLTMELWRCIGLSDATLEQTSPGHFRGSDGHASSGRWEFIYKSPELNVIYAEGEYRGPLLGTNLETKSVLVLRTVFFEERDNHRYVKQQLDGFVKAESGSLKPVAKALRPVFQKSVEATMQEALWFVSLMCRYAVYDPHTVARAVNQTEKVPNPVRMRMQQILAPMVAITPERKALASGGDAAATPGSRP